MKSTEDKKLETLVSLSESCWSEYNSRRSYEWKVSFGLWTAIGVIAGFALKEGVIIPLNQYWIIGLLISIFLAYLWFQAGLYRSCTQDQSKRHIYISFIHSQIGFNTKRLKEKERELFKKRSKLSNSKFFFLVWSHGSQLLITAVFLTILGLILLNRDVKSNKPDSFKCSCYENTRCDHQ